MKIAVIGIGVVGSAVADGLERLGHEIFRHDLKLGTTVAQLVSFRPDVTFVCVPTPSREDGSCDTHIVEDVLLELLRLNYRGIIALKSTIAPGTTERLAEAMWPLNRPSICFVPEFLRERSAFYDFTEGHGSLVIGISVTDPTPQNTIEKITAAHGRYPTKVITLSATEAELVKYYNNVYNAARVTFANGFYEVCKKLRADYTAVKDTFISRGVAKDMYLDVNEHLRGFAGPCLPKETAAFAKLCSDLGVDAQIFRTIVEDNKLYRKTVLPGMRET